MMFGRGRITKSKKFRNHLSHAFVVWMRKQRSDSVSHSRSRGGGLVSALSCQRLFHWKSWRCGKNVLFGVQQLWNHK